MLRLLLLLLGAPRAAPLWSPTPTTAPAVDAVPTRLSKLREHVYGAEHVLTLTDTADGVDAPVLLPFADGDFLARLVEGRAARGGPGLWPELMARRQFFDAADAAVRAAAPASELADGTIVERMLHHARERSLTPVACVLAGGDATGVRLRNLGMNTEAAPTSVQLAQFEVVLVCEDASGAVHPLPLDGLGVAAAISLAAGAPIRMPAATWEARRAVAMPEVESGIDLRSRLQ